MASPSLEDYRRLYFEEKRAKEEAAKEADRKIEEANRRVKEADRRVAQAEDGNRDTNLPEYLDACYENFHLNLAVQLDPTQSTQGCPANANNKLRPDRLVLWEEFPKEQAAIWEKLVESDFADKRCFTSKYGMQAYGKTLKKLIGSESDLNHFLRTTIETPVRLIVEQLYNSAKLRRTFRLQGSVDFENHSNTLSQEGRASAATGRRRSPRLEEKAKEAEKDAKEAEKDAKEAEKDALPPSTPVAAPRQRPRPDQICVYNIQHRKRTAAFVMEYKAPHKLPLNFMYDGFYDMDLKDVIQCETNIPKDRFSRVVAAVITQAFSYMVRMGVEFGCVSTGEAMIFLRVPEDPRTVYYYLSVPKGDVGETTGWNAGSESANRLHLTAVGQMLAFTLRALQVSPREQGWRTKAENELNSWEMAYDEVLQTILKSDTKSSVYRPPKHKGFLRMSPIQLRKRRHAPQDEHEPDTPSRKPDSSRPAENTSSSCDEPEDQYHSDSDDSDPETLSRKPIPFRSGRKIERAGTSTSTSAGTSADGSTHQSSQDNQKRSYCTQRCLLGLARRGFLDPLCPNAQAHVRNQQSMQDYGQIRHSITSQGFRTRIRKQLAENRDVDCYPEGVHGACGALFQVTLRSHGYTVAAKTSPMENACFIQQEAEFYQRLRSLQGITVPVHLGNIDLELPYYYEGIPLYHMMFMSFGGKPLSQHLSEENRTSISQQKAVAEQKIRDNGVLHLDFENRNILWNEENNSIMVIDFERAEAIKPRRALGKIAANRKRARDLDIRGSRAGKVAIG
ncbi:hypothetical protein BU24DRAFT_337592 [Aaosphaeria arxii CBS 175.79]|uniref:Protein kinase domain-containing protein n=1 Tax=Aaosphaeria arxii CBS 175.79 TaxID=1450172 RepID=A0A6A5YAX9_9PLEO|nr:uncharacterized protein BU24DRAFT_337592 [Aaosphaeria arxii CBS 175.79]KAF2021930.1 hypothetical protein BU24DRAFT_337592 [Aaosphaeria arxii CBS 175.79]